MRYYPITPNILQGADSMRSNAISHKQDQETWLRWTQIPIPLSQYQFPEILINLHLFQYMSSNFINCQSLPKIAEDCRTLEKIVEDRRRSPKIGKERQRLMKITEDR